ncbi:hypothetical protein [Nocardia sp. XZ_19_385]|uniref:hypothetical protein n=1 Tax=Nocardia sp. XZ_19_385 TaxID=2769488 RepID=UPI00188F01E5|nr:hypothetical protein [Nocardia sp. XZ_19_385]
MTRFLLLTVESAQPSGDQVRLLPRIPISDLIARGGGQLQTPMPGSPLELRLPSGETASARVAAFGVESWQREDGTLYTTSDPSSPELTLTLDGASIPGDIPPGTEIWLPARE